MELSSLEQERELIKLRNWRSQSFGDILPAKRQNCQVADVKLPIRPPKRKRSVRRRSRQIMLGSKETDSVASISSSQSNDSEKTNSSTLSRMKAAVIGKLRPSDNLKSLPSPNSSQPMSVSCNFSADNGQTEDPNANSEETKAKIRASKEKDRIERCQKELELGLRYLREVVRTEKLEMLGGSSSAVLDVVLKLLVVLNEKGSLEQAGDTLKRPGKPSISGACTKVYKKLNELLQWADKSLSNLEGGKTWHKQVTMEELESHGKSLQTAIQELLDLVRRTDDTIVEVKRASRDSGTGASLEADQDSQNNNSNHSPNSSSVVVPPPKPLHPSQMRTKNNAAPPVPPRRRVSPPMSGDSGIFNDSLSLTNQNSDESNGSMLVTPTSLIFVTPMSTPNANSSPNLFSSGSLDNILERLDLSDSYSLPPGGNFPAVNGDDSGFDESGQSGSTSTTFEDTRENREANQVSSTSQSEEMTENGGRKITTTKISRVQVQRMKHSKVSTTITSLADGENLENCNSDSDLLKMIRASRDGELKITENQQLQFGVKNSNGKLSLTKSLSELSPYDNTSVVVASPITVDKCSTVALPLKEKLELLELPVPPGVPNRASFGSDYDNDFSTPEGSSNDNSPDHKPKLPPKLYKKTEKVMKESSSMQNFDQKTLVNGSVVAKQSGQKLDNQKFEAAKSETFENGALVDRKGAGAYTEWTHCKGDQEIVPPDCEAPPPLPPKRRHVAVYMDLIRPQKPPEADKDQHEESSARTATLASYVILRDKWRQHEEAYRQKTCAFQFSGGAHKRSSYATPWQDRKASGFLSPHPDQNYNNLADFMNWSENIHFPTKSSPKTESQKALQHQRRLALPCASVLGSLESHESLIMRKTPSDSEEVWGGSVDGIIVYATQPGNHVLVYQEAFLTTYRTFIEPVDLIRRLVWRYQNFVADRDKEQAKRKAARNTFSLIVRVVDELCPFELKSEVLDEVNTFIYRLVEEGELNLARLLRQRLLERLQNKMGFRNSLMIMSTSHSSPEQISKPLHFLEVKSEHLAEQMTRVDADLFHKIEMSEMLSWSQEQSEETSPNLVNFTEHFNKMSYWTRSRVLEPQEHKDREKAFVKFIKIMKHLKRLGNFNSYLAVLSALESGPVRRLDWSKSVVDSMAELSAIMDSSQSFKNYRTALSEAKPPCLPYIGLILQDLTFVHVGNKNFMRPEAVGGRSDILNFGKRWQQYTILDSVRRFKAWPFGIKKNDEITAVFGNFENYLGEDSIWELSEKLKPRGSRKIQI